MERPEKPEGLAERLVGLERPERNAITGRTSGRTSASMMPVGCW